MKKLFVLLAIVVLALPTLAQQPFTITGNVNLLKTGDKLYLKFLDQNKVDSTIVNDGKFEFKGMAVQPMEAILSLNTKSMSTEKVRFYIEPGNITIKSAANLTLATVSGTPTNVDYNTLNEVLKPYQDKFQAIKKEPNTYTKAQLADKSVMDALLAKYFKALEEINSMHVLFVKNHPKSFVSVIALTKAVQDLAILSVTSEKLFTDIETSYLKLSNNIKETENGKELGTLIKEAKKTSVGVIAMDFSQNDYNDKVVKLSDYKGKYILLDFWASWCVPCRAENPNLIKVYNKYKNSNFTILSVSIDKENQKDAWLKAIKDDGMVWTNVSDLNPIRNQVAEAWNVEAVPTTFLIDPAGKIIAVNLRGEALNSKLTELLGDKTK